MKVNHQLLHNDIMGRILAIDFGSSRIGLALTDPAQIIGSPFKTLQVKGKKFPAIIDLLLEVIKEKDVELILLGLPLLLSGKDSDTTKQVREFAALLEKNTKLPLELIDERLTSRLAMHTLKEAGLNRKERSKHVDEISASIILQGYLDSKY